MYEKFRVYSTTLCRADVEETALRLLYDPSFTLLARTGSVDVRTKKHIPLLLPHRLRIYHSSQYLRRSAAMARAEGELSLIFKPLGPLESVGR